ncbi:GreA/GreB family elongation factor [Rhodoferax fermentans]|uniref:Transcription elongation factor GreAB n=1 Tax=Rhodoferax fermentans TaxID=28066 RepID=A0A1T1AMZ5_RHOFE|nr:GreA/GreB family elongation factor [Rhodoferax fermentans]MBK1684487.1 transcription elongation factor GreAB [Rhodoferax fermentans]OOV05512.1 transcription elongation factor GreAB [Rhodoferax fermentans]
MHKTLSGQRLLTELDFTRLSKLNRGQLPEDLAEDLNSADLVVSQDIAPDIVTMNSQVEIVHDGSALRQKFTLCYPANADAGRGLISVLSPVGAALLGRRVGDTACWTMPQGEARSAKVAAILFQPEASGDYTT